MLEVIKKRRSIRKYLDKPVEKEKIEEILKAVMFSPSAMHRRPWEFVVIEDKELKEQLSQATPWGDFAAKAPAIIIVLGDGKLSPRWLEDCSITGAYIYLEAENQGLGTCWNQIYESKTPSGQDSEKYVRKLLKIPASFRVLALFPIGYPAERKEEHKDKEFEKKKVHKEGW